MPTGHQIPVIVTDYPEEAGEIRRRLWRSIRIMRRFTIPDLLQVGTGASSGEVRKFVRRAAQCGFVGKQEGVARSQFNGFQGYVLLKDVGLIPESLMKY